MDFNKNIQTVGYIICMTLSLSFSYMVYTKYLANFNFGLAFAALALIKLISFKTVYLHVQHFALGLFGVQSTKAKEQMSYRQAFSRNSLLLLLYGVFGAVGFMVMLPYLTNAQAALAFIIFSTLGKTLQVPFAVIAFGDKITHPIQYYIGLAIIGFGCIFYQTAGIPLTDIQFGKGILLAAIVNAVCGCFGSLFLRSMTTEALAKSKYVPVKVAQEFQFMTFLVVGVIMGFYYLPTYQGMTVRMPTQSEFWALALIGTIVPFCGSIAQRIVNEISHSVARSADGIRVVLGTLLTILLAVLMDDTEGLFSYPLQKVAGITFVLFGVFYSFRYGQPQKPNYSK